MLLIINTRILIRNDGHLVGTANSMGVRRIDGDVRRRRKLPPARDATEVRMARVWNNYSIPRVLNSGVHIYILVEFIYIFRYTYIDMHIYIHI